MLHIFFVTCQHGLGYALNVGEQAQRGYQPSYSLVDVAYHVVINHLTVWLMWLIMWLSTILQFG
jgi:hypothetical protein